MATNLNLYFTQECIPVGCILSATVAVCFRGGGSLPSPPEQAPPQDQAPPPRAGTPLETCCKACWDTTCNACWDSTPPVNRITDTCKNITFAISLRTVTTQHSIRMRTARLPTVRVLLATTRCQYCEGVDPQENKF